MTSAPADLLAFRQTLLQVTGLSGNALGISPDPEHLSTGGYHVGPADIRRIGRFDSDYSTRQTRDRNVGGNSASAVDVGSTWRPSRASWLRFNNLLYQEMRDRPGNLPALRAINVSLDGTRKQRYDQLHRGDGLIASKDTVDTHTHLSFWRDTEGRRSATLNRIVELARAAVANTSPAAQTGDDVMGTWTEPITQGNPGYAGHQRDTALAFAWQSAAEAKANTDRLLAEAAGDKARDEATLLAIKALAVGGPVEAAPLINAINAVGDKVTVQVAELQARVVELEAELEQHRRARHDAAQAEADATADKP